MSREPPVFTAFILTFFIVFLSLQFFFQKDVFMVSNIVAGIGAGFLAMMFVSLVHPKEKEMRRFELVENQHRKHPDVDLKMPEKATQYSACYDFYSPERVRIAPKEQHMFWTDVKVVLRLDEKLEISPRSSIGTKKHLMLANTIGTIDADYYGNEDNDGNIGICMYNYGGDFATIEKDERFAQGSIVLIAFDPVENNKKERTGGFGSTGEK
jgi:dUTP pyrophosphatase